MQSHLHSYDKPPVVETVMGIQFEPILGFTNGHLGLFWARLGGRKEWPTAKDVPPLGQEFERFGDEQEWAPLETIKFGVSGVPTSRLQLRKSSRDRMIQIQNGKLIYNWIGTEGAEYARYEKVRPEFDAIRKSFEEFLADQELHPMTPNQWEVTYVNHMPKGTVWNDASDWNKVLTFHAVPPMSMNKCRLEDLGGQWSYEIEPRQGRLHMQLRHGWHLKRVEMLMLNLTARGPFKESDVDAGLNLGHEIIVKTFTELASPEARKYWGQET
jgi:uncharacterized protein (TIGR04255 family)